MPQPLRPGSANLEYRPKIVLLRPQHAAGIAMVACEWAALEDEMVHSFSFSLFALTNPEAHRILRQTWESLDSLKARLEMVRSIAEDRITEALYKELTEDIFKQIRARSRERNRVVHGIWNICASYPEDLILTSKDAPPMVYTANDFNEIADRIIATLNNVATFWHAKVGHRAA